MRSERQALADIAVECDKARNDAVRRGRVTPYWVRAVEPILAEVQPEPAPVGGTIDRDALIAAQRVIGEDPHKSADRILALVRPVDGVVLTPEEASLARQGAIVLAGLNERMPGAIRPERVAAYVALAKRLEAAS